MSTYRLIREVVKNAEVEITLAHGSSVQDQDDGHFRRIIKMPRVDIVGNRILSYARQVRFLVASYSWMRKNYREFDVMFTPASNILTLLPSMHAMLMGIPVVGRVAAAGTELYDNGKGRTMMRLSSRRASLISRLSSVLAISREIQERLYLLGVPPEKVIYFPNSVDCLRFRPADPTEKSNARRRFGIPADARIVVLLVGAVTRRKGQHLLVQALSDLPANVHLLLVGPAREAEYSSLLASSINANGLAGRVHRCGHIEDVQEAYYASDIFALPSTDEGMPNALVEAMSAGLACIGTQISGISELLDEERGIIVKRDAGAIAEAIGRYLEAPSLMKWHADSGRMYVTTHQNSKIAAGKFYDLLLEASTK
ncbi:glycosyltransferase family 4 protein [Mesorhizobium sp. M1295]|uniref:glycosyltransferase family 4 protein n=1 Tax=Mesorhizobium sp. M1295 TaxID=2957076 RepID=UPI00333931AF